MNKPPTWLRAILAIIVIGGTLTITAPANAATSLHKHARRVIPAKCVQHGPIRRPVIYPECIIIRPF